MYILKGPPLTMQGVSTILTSLYLKLWNDTWYCTTTNLEKVVHFNNDPNIIILLL